MNQVDNNMNRPLMRLYRALMNQVDNNMNRPLMRLYPYESKR